jgi:ABC-type sugar transport system substrate-binding protein
MKRFFAIGLALLLVFTVFAGCQKNAPANGGDVTASAAPSGASSPDGSASGGTGGGKKPLIGLSLPSESQSIYAMTGDAVRAIFPDCEVQVASCDNDVTTQISQIKNFVLLGAEMIIVTPTEIEALSDTVMEAYDEGIKIIINGSAGDSSLLQGKFNTCSVSDEYLIGAYVGLVAKNWAESHLDPDGNWETVFLISQLNDDTVARSDGLRSVLGEYLSNKDGEYTDAMGNVVAESAKIANPGYSKLIAGHFKGAVIEQDMSQSNYTTVSNAMTQYPNARLFICYNSLASTEGGQYVVDNYPNELGDFGFFSAGVMGQEPDYLVGSLSDTDGTKSVFRGACEFGGGDVAGAVADLSYRVFYGEEGRDYSHETAQGIGLWWGVDEKQSGDGTAYLAKKDILNGVTVEPYDSVAELKSAVIYWDSKNGVNEAAAAEVPQLGGLPPIDGAPPPPAGISGPVAAGVYTYDEETPFGFTVNWTLTLEDGGGYKLLEGNAQMGDTEYSGESWTDKGDGTVSLSALQGGKPLAGFFAADLTSTWAVVGDGAVVPAG